MENTRYNEIGTRKLEPERWEAYYIQDNGWTSSDSWSAAEGMTKKEAIDNLKKKFMKIKRKVCVTGSHGFIGKHLVNRLIKEGNEVIPLDLKIGLNILTAPLPDVDKVIHLAAQTDAFFLDAYKDAETNILGTIRLMEKYREKLVFISSGMVNYPQSPYAISKTCGELYAKFFNCPVTRLTNVYGEGGHSCWDKFREADELIIYGNGEQKRTYAKVEDACDLIIKAMNEGGFHILPGEVKTVNELADMFDKPRKHLPERKLDLINAIQL